MIALLTQLGVGARRVDRSPGCTVINAALRRGELVDGFIDFDAALADPADATRLKADYDSGDHPHPSTAGQRAMADIAAATLPSMLGA